MLSKELCLHGQVSEIATLRLDYSKEAKGMSTLHGKSCGAKSQSLGKLTQAHGPQAQPSGFAV